MKLRPSTKDRKAIDKLKKHYASATGTKAILQAVYDVPTMQTEIDNLNQKLLDLGMMLQRAQTAQSLLLDGIEDMKLSRKEITNR